MVEEKKQTTYVQILVFPCGRCNWPLADCSHSANEQEQESFAGRVFELACHRCEWVGNVFGGQAVLFQQAEWSFEIRLLLHTNKPPAPSAE